MVAAPCALAAGDDLTGRKWRIESLKGTGTIDTGQTEFVIDAGGRLATTIGCNRMGAAAKIDGDKLSFSQLMSTRMACAEALMDQEMLYGDTLLKVHSYAIENGLLVLKSKAGDPLITLAPGQ
jgi:heat shock protein HslJ